MVLFGLATVVFLVLEKTDLVRAFMAEMRLWEDIVAVVGGIRRRLDGMQRKASGCYWLGIGIGVSQIEVF